MPVASSGNGVVAWRGIAFDVWKTKEKEVTVPSEGARSPRSLYPALIAFSVAAATLLLQIVQTRIYAVVFWNHLVYFIVSVALLGFGISGTWLSFGKSTWIARVLTLRNAAAGFVVTAIVSSLLVPQWGTSLGAIFTSKWHLMRLMATYGTAALPYFCAGWILGVVYRDYAERIHFLYFADLLGAGVGCLLFLALIRPVGAVALVLLACALVALPILCGEFKHGNRFTATALLAGVPIALLLLFLWRGAIDARIVPDTTKGFNVMYADLARPDEKVVEFSEWNSIARTDVVGTKLAPGKRIFIDGDAFTGMEVTSSDTPPPFDRDKEALVPHKTPYVLDRKIDSVLVIGSGGGRDVWDAVRAGAHHVDAVEINPTTARIVANEYRKATHDLFLRPEVTLWNEEGRSFIRSRDTRYSVVMINAIDTFAALDAGAYMLSENYLYTLDGMMDYVSHLAPDGILCITRWDYAGETPRLFTTMLEALYALGYEQPNSHIVAQTRNFWTAIMVSPTPFTDTEVTALRHHTAQHDGTFYFPLPAAEREKPFQKDLNEYAQARANGTQEAFLQSYYYNIRPVRDDSPFFFHYERLRNLLQVLREHAFVDYVRGHWPSFTLSTLLTLMSAALAVFIFLPLIRRGRGDMPQFGLWLVYFCCLGVSFIFVEISLMQRFALLLGHPARSLALVLACLLIFAGIGSHLKERLAVSLGASLGFLMAAILVAAFLYPVFIERLLGFPLWIRSISTVILVAPVALCMGMPFPYGIRRVSDQARDAVPWMWGVNGGATVVGSILAIICAIRFNFTTVLVFAALGYGIALAVYFRLTRGRADGA